MFSPSDLGSSLAAWYDPSDASTVHATGALVDRLDDKSGNGFHMLQTGSVRLTYNATAVMGTPGVVGAGAQYMKASGVNIGTSQFAAFALTTATTQAVSARLLSYRANGDAADSSAHSIRLLTADDGSPPVLNSFATARLSTSFGMLVVGTSHGGVAMINQPLVAGVFLRLGTVCDGANNTFYIDNMDADPVAFTRGVTAPGTLSILGSDNGTACWTGVLGETIIMNRAPTATERENIHTYLARHWRRMLVVEGDSIPHSGPPDGYTHQYRPNANVSTFLNVIAVGGSNHSSYTASDPAPGRYSSLTYRAPFYLYPRIPANKRGMQYVLYFATTNNIGGPTNNAVAAAAAWGQYALDAKTAGFDKVIISTVIPRTDAQSNELRRTGLNAIVTAPGWAAAHGVDAIADFAADPIMGALSAPTVNPGYFQDDVHPNAAGHARLAAIFGAAMNTIQFAHASTLCIAPTTQTVDVAFKTPRCAIAIARPSLDLSLSWERC